MRRRLLVIALLASPSPALAQESDEEWLEHCTNGRWNGRRPTACDVRVQNISRRDVLRVRPGQNGGVHIIADDRSDIELHTRLQAAADSRSEANDLLRAIEVDVGSTITATGPERGGDRHWSVSFVIYVPRNTNLDLETRNGPVAVKNVVGRMQLSAVNGPISLSGVGGDVRAHAQNGPLQVRLTGDRWDGAGLNAETENGPVQLAIPDHYNAVLETGTVNGPVQADFPVTVTLDGRTNWKRFTFKLGEGGAPVRVVTTNGPLTLRRRN